MKKLDESPLKVIFLDIDGVLCTPTEFSTRGYYKEYGDNYCKFNNDCVRMLNTLVSQSKAKIVISSSWRSLTDLDGLRKIFALRGVTATVLDTTPRLDKPSESGIYVAVPRGAEINAWLEEHPEVEKYVILDDEMSVIEPYCKNTVKTSWTTGLTSKEVYKALTYLS